MANDTVTSLRFCSVTTRNGKRIGETHLSYYASTYNRMETNQPHQDLFINSIHYLCNCCSSVPITYQCLMTLVV